MQIGIYEIVILGVGVEGIELLWTGQQIPGFSRFRIAAAKLTQKAKPRIQPRGIFRGGKLNGNVARHHPLGARP